MAPEQAGGGMVDHRADIWSFGVVLCEMVTGTRPAPGVRLRVEAAPEPERIIAKCLEPERELRLPREGTLRDTGHRPLDLGASGHCPQPDTVLVYDIRASAK